MPGTPGATCLPCPLRLPGPPGFLCPLRLPGPPGFLFLSGLLCMIGLRLPP